MEELYEKNENFKFYVDGFCKQRNIDKEEAFEYKIVKETARHFNNIAKDKVNLGDL